MWGVAWSICMGDLVLTLSKPLDRLINNDLAEERAEEADLAWIMTLFFALPNGHMLGAISFRVHEPPCSTLLSIQNQSSPRGLVITPEQAEGKDQIRNSTFDIEQSFPMPLLIPGMKSPEPHSLLKHQSQI